MRYEPMVLGLPGQPPVPERRPEAGQAGLLFCPGATVAHITVMRAAVWVQFGLRRIGQGNAVGAIEWEAELLMLPVMASYPQPVDAVRCWAYSKAGEAPQITVSVA
jgi:hypothetical protein